MYHSNDFYLKVIKNKQNKVEIYDFPKYENGLSENSAYKISFFKKDYKTKNFAYSFDCALLDTSKNQYVGSLQFCKKNEISKEESSEKDESNWSLFNFILRPEYRGKRLSSPFLKAALFVLENKEKIFSNNEKISFTTNEILNHVAFERIYKKLFKNYTSLNDGLPYMVQFIIDATDYEKIHSELLYLQYKLEPTFLSNEQIMQFVDNDPINPRLKEKFFTDSISAEKKELTTWLDICKSKQDKELNYLFKKEIKSRIEGARKTIRECEGSSDSSDSSD